MSGHTALSRPGESVILAAVGALLCLSAAPQAEGSPQHRQVWVKDYDGPASDIDIAYDIARSPDGSRVFVTGRSSGHSSGDDFATVAYDATTGARAWRARWSGIGSDAAYSIAASADGSKVFITGSSTGKGGDDYATVAYDASSGSELWVKRYDGPGGGFDDANSVAASPDGSKVFVTGGSSGLSTGSDYATVAYDSSSGARLWSRRYNGPGNGSDFASSVAVSQDGLRVVVTGESSGLSSGLDYATVAYDAASGSPLWVKRYNGPGNGFDDALSVEVHGSRVFVTGQSSGLSTALDYATVAYDAASGARLWMNRYNGPGNGSDFASSVAVSPDGSAVFLTGGSTGTIGYNYATVAYDASTGGTLWIRRYGGGSDPETSGAIASSVAVSPDGSRTYVTGGSASDSGNWNYATVAYDALTGANVWAKVHDGPANGYDDAFSITTSPDGSRVFVTGESTGTSTEEDYATVAYTA